MGQEGIPVEHFEPQSLSGRFVLFDSSRAACPELTSDQVAIDVHALRGSSAEDPFALLDDEQSRRVRWWVGHLAVSEEVSRVDKRAARQQLLAGVRTLVEMAGGIWLRATAFPYPYRSAFNFRLDYDEYQAEDFATVLDIVAPHEECFSHFVCAASFENEPQALARLRGMDVGSHGYWHHTYDDLLENRRNVTRGVAVLRAHGIEPSGFVAPHGRFNRGLLAVLQELGVGHSSEFGLAYDELPFFPVDSNVLQVPVHPICLGICLEAAAESGGTGTPALRAAADVLAEYFRWIATAKYQAGEPIFLYGHPENRLGRFPQVLRGVLETVSQFAAVWKTTLTEFAAWWRARATLRMRVYRDGANFVIFVDERRRATAVASNTGAASTRLPCRSTNRWFDFLRWPWLSKVANRATCPHSCGSISRSACARNCCAISTGKKSRRSMRSAPTTGEVGSSARCGGFENERARETTNQNSIFTLLKSRYGP